MDTESKNRIVRLICILFGVVLLVVMALCMIKAVQKNSENGNEEGETEYLSADTNTPEPENAGERETETAESAQETASSDPEEVNPAAADETVSEENAEETSASAYPVNDCETVLGTRLSEKFRNDFYVGVCVIYSMIGNEAAEKLILEQFNSVTFENEMKPEVLLNRTASIVNDELTVVWPKNTIAMLDWARDNGLSVRGHTLVWYSQTPDWIFYEDYDTTKELVDRDEMLRRMESMIRQEMEYINENYPGLVYAWDVVNEAFSDTGSGLRENYWYQIIGEDYIEYAFTYARKYAGDIKLFLNDYNTYINGKYTAMYKVASDLAEKGLLDGIGMQSHLDVNYPSAALFCGTVEKFAKLGLEIEITEMDITTEDTSEAGLKKQTDMYRDIFEKLVSWDREGKINLTAVTIWGLTDKVSWRAAKVPTLFNEDLSPKDAYTAIWEIE